ncbi:MAG: SPFH domain-containing protein [Anaerolineae bacterium]|nr:SPFH domain-containing protein [Anaerolineae bacterium]
MTTSNVPSVSPVQRPRNMLETLYRVSVVVLAAIILLTVILVIARAAIYKVHPYERGIHMRGGQFLSVDQPGWHFKIPLWDTVILVRVNERLGYVDQISAMTADDVTMIVSLQYTYVVTDPRRFALEVDDPERILFEFVQGKLRDVVNTKSMTEVMHDRARMNQEIMEALKTKEDQYGVRFVTVQIQSASPPEEVVQAIKDRMVAVQRQEQAQAEAEQVRIRADAEYYAAQKRAEAEAYQITLVAEAQRKSIQMLIAELAQYPDIATEYLRYLTAQELKANSKWIITGDSTPIVDLRSGGGEEK